MLMMFPFLWVRNLGAAYLGGSGSQSPPGWLSHSSPKDAQGGIFFTPVRVNAKRS